MEPKTQLGSHRKGRFAPGQSGNPGGRPKGAEDIKELARTHTTEAFNTIVYVMRNGKPMERIQAARTIIERGWGRPASGSEESSHEPMQVVIHWGEKPKADGQVVL